MILTGAGQIGMAIARRMGYGMKIVVGDKRRENAEQIADIMNKAGFDAVPLSMDLASRSSVLAMINAAQQYGEIKYLINANGLSRLKDVGVIIRAMMTYRKFPLNGVKPQSKRLLNVSKTKRNISFEKEAYYHEYDLSYLESRNVMRCGNKELCYTSFAGKCYS